MTNLWKTLLIHAFLKKVFENFKDYFWIALFDSLIDSWSLSLTGPGFRTIDIDIFCLQQKIIAARAGQDSNRVRVGISSALGKTTGRFQKNEYKSKIINNGQKLDFWGYVSSLPVTLRANLVPAESTAKKRSFDLQQNRTGSFWEKLEKVQKRRQI